MISVSGRAGYSCTTAGMASATVATATIQRAVLLAVIVLPSLFRLPADRSGERRPFGFLGVDVGRIVFRRAQPRLGALVGEPLAHLVGRERPVELAVDTFDDRAWRAGRGHQPVMQLDLVAGETGLGDGRHPGHH